MISLLSPQTSIPLDSQVEQLRAAEVSGYAVKRWLSVTCDAIVRLNDDAWPNGPTWQPWPKRKAAKVGEKIFQIAKRLAKLVYTSNTYGL